MNTNDLIASLSETVPAVSRRTAMTRLILTVAAGLLVTLVMLSVTLGARPDLDVAMAGALFWMKMSYTGSIALIAIAGVLTLARPEASPPRWLWLALVPVLLLTGISMAERASMEFGDWMKLWMGDSWRTCPVLIFSLSLPIGAALMYALRDFAPTRLRLTGALIGLGSGAAAAMVYCLHCPEVGASFVLTWYSLGIALSAAAGAIAGPRLLRW